ncbi:MAG: Mur ligase family protein [Acidobacteriota bacterium]|nr:Mur ligase family protein [Acidobacteriota bacterium]
MSSSTHARHFDFFLQVTARRIAGKAAMRERFPPILSAWFPDPGGMHIIRIAGTNGKGSVCAMLEACLRSSNRVGVFTGPHLVSVTERFRIDGAPANDAMLTEICERFRLFLDNWLSRHGPEMTPSFFEVLVLIALAVFREAGVKVAVFEAGIGGYNDAVSCLPGIISAVTTVGLDHQDRLGSGLEEIAADKAGIASERGMLVLGPGMDEKARTALFRDARKRNVTVIEAIPVAPVEKHRNGSRFQITEPGFLNLFDLPAETLYLNLAGDHQLRNAGTVLALSAAAKTELGIESDLIGLSRISWPGRLQWFRIDSRYWLADVAHNLEAVQALRCYLDDRVPHAERILIYGAAADKDYAPLLPAIKALAPQIILTGGFYRSIQPEALAEEFPSDAEYRCASSIAEAIEEARALCRQSPHVGVIIAGSVFLVGAVFDQLKIPTHPQQKPPGQSEGGVQPGIVSGNTSLPPTGGS